MLTLRAAAVIAFCIVLTALSTTAAQVYVARQSANEIYKNCLITKRNVHSANIKWGVVRSQMLSSAEGLRETNPALSATYRHNATLIIDAIAPVCTKP